MIYLYKKQKQKYVIKFKNKTFTFVTIIHIQMLDMYKLVKSDIYKV